MTIVTRTAADEILFISRGHIGLPAFRHILSDRIMQGIPLVLETPSFELTAIWTKDIEVLNQLSTMDDTGGDDGNEDRNRRRGEDDKWGCKGSKKSAKVGISKSSAKRGRTKIEENEGSDGEPHGH